MFLETDKVKVLALLQFAYRVGRISQKRKTQTLNNLLYCFCVTNKEKNNFDLFRSGLLPAT